MKNTILKKTLITLLILLLSVSAVFAGGNKENQTVEVASIDASAEGTTTDGTEAQGGSSQAANTNANAKSETASFDNAEISAFKNEWNDFVNKYDEITAKMDMAYDKNDAIAYRDAKSELWNLQAPELTKERTEMIAASLVDTDYENANWLFTYSEYYHPVLKFVSSSEGFNYTSSFSANPGTDVNVPFLKGPNGRLVFQGWSLAEGGNVIYKAGDVIKMPVKDITLYAVFAPNPEIVEGKHLTLSSISVNGSEGLTLPQGKQAGVKVELKNIGSENLKNVEIKFESDDPLFVILSDTLHCHFLHCADDVVARFRVITKAPSGTKLKGTLTASDSEGVLWTEDVTFSVL